MFGIKMLDLQLPSCRGLLDNNEICSRGLESRTRADAQQRRQKIEATVNAVLCEQERQWEQDFHSTRCLAEIYQKSSAQSSMIAYLAALKDAKVVQGEIQNSLVTIKWRLHYSHLPLHMEK